MISLQTSALDQPDECLVKADAMKKGRYCAVRNSRCQIWFAVPFIVLRCHL
jgi:hypothetical protein